MQAQIDTFASEPAASVTEVITPSSESSVTQSENATEDQALVSSAVDSLVADTTPPEKPSDVTAVEVPAALDPVTPASPAETSPTETTPEQNDTVTIGHKKVIQPINDLTTKTDLNALLAKEVANASTTSIVTESSTVPAAPTAPSVPDAKDSAPNPPKDPLDPSSIAL